MKVFKKLFYVLGCVLISANFSFAAEKKALLVGVGNYGEDSDWCSTKATNDVLLMQRTLDKNGFHYSKSHTNEDATKSAIKNSLLRFVEILDTGDVFLFYFSGHGQLVKDQNADEFDGLDEALVLYGAPKSYNKAYKMENHLLDEELSALLNRIRSKLGSEGELIVIIDAGFGYGNNGDVENITRGGSEPYGEFDEETAKFKVGDSEIGFVDDVPFNHPNLNYAEITEIVASSNKTGAFDYINNGLLTFAVAQSLDLVTDSTSYLDFTNNISNIIKTLNSDQIVIVDGSLDRNMFRHVKGLSYLDSQNAISRGAKKISEKETIILKELRTKSKEEGERDRNQPDYKKREFTL